MRFESAWLAIPPTYENDPQSTPLHDVGGDVPNIYATGNVGAILAQYFGGARRTVGVAVCDGIDAAVCNALSIGIWRAV